MKRRYGLAVVFVTLLVVLLTESARPVDFNFTLERTGSTLAGGLLALGAALVFWPVWERGRFPGIMMRALRANAAYLQSVLTRLREGGLYDETVIAAKRAAESANAEVFSSLNRMTGDPENRRALLKHAAVLANGNRRITGSLSVIALHLDDQRSRHPEVLKEFGRIAAEAFEALASLQTAGASPAAVQSTLNALESFRLPPPDAGETENPEPGPFLRERWILPRLAHILAELGAMLPAAAETGPGGNQP